MSREISQSVPWAAIDRVLGELEKTTHSMEDFTEDLKIGPFGSFWTQQSLTMDDRVDEVVPENDNQALDLLLFDDTCLLPDQSTLFDFGDTIGCPSLDFDFDWPDCSAPHTWPGEQPILSSLGPLDFHLPMVNRSELTDVIPSNAYYLMEHYRNQMVGLFSPVHVVQSPWKALHLPCASNALADLTLRGESKEARTALFYAILSVSAFNLNKVNSEVLTEGAETSMHWWEVGVSYREKAKKALQSCLRQERNGSAKSKYKEVLMAMLSMITICVSHCASCRSDDLF
jgi:arginine metabolism regulation protein II